MVTILLVAVAVLCFAASISWLRSGLVHFRYWKNLLAEIGTQRATATESENGDEDEQSEADTSDKDIVERESDLVRQARYDYLKLFHTFSLYVILGAICITLAATNNYNAKLVLLILVIPLAVSISWINLSEREERAIARRKEQEKRAEATLTQDQLAPRAWAERLAPEELPEIEGLEVAKIYQAGSGLIAGDFYDVFRVSDSRMAAVIGDVAGKDIESSITAFQVKYLLRVFLRQFRDPAQALEELNRQLTVHANEDFVSIVVLLFDAEAGVLRYASAGHPIAWLWHDREIHPMKFTGPVVMLDSASTFYSREITVQPGDVVLMYTDGLSEARKSSSEIFGEERVGDMLRRDPNVSVDVMCKQILDTAIEYSEGPIIDDMAMLAIRLKEDWMTASRVSNFDSNSSVNGVSDNNGASNLLKDSSLKDSGENSSSDKSSKEVKSS